MIVVSATTLSPAGVSAATAPTVSDAGVTDSFPNGMTFTVNASSDSPINELKIRYKILPDGTSANGSPKFEPGTSVAATFNLGGADLYLPPGTVIEYHWEATDADGDESRTETASFFYDDVRFQWAPLEANGVTIFYYSGSEQDAQKMLETASETIGSMSQLLGANITFPIKVWIYKSRDDMRPALQRRSATFEQQITTLGVRVSSDTVLVLGNSDLDTLRHELTHVVTHIAGESALGRLPAWLDEGTAVYGQGDPGGFENAVDQAISRGNVFSVRQITSSPGDPAGVNLFYGQSWSLVKYLNDTYGPEKFAKLFAEIKKGNTVDDALKAAYGFDQDGLDNEWRAAHGLPPRATEEPKQNEQPQTTAGASGSQNTSQNDDGGGTSTFVLVALAVGLLVLAGAVGLAGWAVARRL
jgi:Peptidase MA superfamily